jgi:hypothetical protein
VGRAFSSLDGEISHQSALNRVSGHTHFAQASGSQSDADILRGCQGCGRFHRAAVDREWANQHIREFVSRTVERVGNLDACGGIPIDRDAGFT